MHTLRLAALGVLGIECRSSYVVVIMKMNHIGSMFECLVPNWWNCLGKIRRCSLVESWYWGWALRFQKSSPFRMAFSLPVSNFWIRCKLSATAPCHIFLPAACSPPWWSRTLLPSGTVSFLSCICYGVSSQKSLHSNHLNDLALSSATLLFWWI